MVALPHATRKQVFDALFALMQTVTAPTGLSWKTFSQRLEMWDDVPHTNQPAMFLNRSIQTAEQKHAFGVTRWQWQANIWIYFRTDGLKTANTYPDQVTDQILDSFEQAFQTEPFDGLLTLGDLVHHCWIDGSIFVDNGIVDNQAVIVIPISILL